MALSQTAGGSQRRPPAPRVKVLAGAVAAAATAGAETPSLVAAALLSPQVSAAPAGPAVAVQLKARRRRMALRPPAAAAAGTAPPPATPTAAAAGRGPGAAAAAAAVVQAGLAAAHLRLCRPPLLIAPWGKSRWSGPAAPRSICVCVALKLHQLCVSSMMAATHSSRAVTGTARPRKMSTALLGARSPGCADRPAPGPAGCVAAPG